MNTQNQGRSNDGYPNIMPAPRQAQQPQRQPQNVQYAQQPQRQPQRQPQNVQYAQQPQRQPQRQPQNVQYAQQPQNVQYAQQPQNVQYAQQPQRQPQNVQYAQQPQNVQYAQQPQRQPQNVQYAQQPQNVQYAQQDQQQGYQHIVGENGVEISDAYSPEFTQEQFSSPMETQQYEWETIILEDLTSLSHFQNEIFRNPEMSLQEKYTAIENLFERHEHLYDDQ